MDKISSEALTSLVLAISGAISFFVSRANSKKNQAVTTSEGAAVKLRVDQKALEVKGEVISISAEIQTMRDELETKRILLEAKLFERLDSLERLQANQDSNMRRLIKRVGLEWTEETTTLKGNKT